MSSEAELMKMWRIFPVTLGDPLHLRAIGPKGIEGSWKTQNLIFTPDEYPDVPDRLQAFADAALELNARLYNIYTCINQIKSGHPLCDVDDSDIACRRHVLIDIDRTGSSTVSATDGELDNAQDLADKVAAFLSIEWAVDLFRVMSGNGVHLYLPIADVPNDSDSKDRCMRLLRWLGSKFDNEHVKIDTVVFNASRITKVPGTIMRKGAETAERPHRMARVL